MSTTKGKETKELIINHCKELFYTHGYKACTTRIIAKEAGVNLGLLNYYFKGKNELGTMIYFGIRDKLNEIIDEIDFNASEMDHFLFSSSVELYVCLRNVNFAIFYLDMMKEKNVNEKIQNRIIDSIKRLGINRDNPSYSLLSAISLSAIKPALVLHAITVEERQSIDDYILYYLEQQLSYFGRPIAEAQLYLDKLKDYHIDIATNFTPIMQKIK